MNRHEDWMRQAQNDVAWAKASLQAGFFAQVCFVCQQAAEKGLKALAFRRGFDLVKSHSITKIAERLAVNGDIEKAGRVLDLYYVSGRYPDSFPEGAPCDFFTVEQASQAIALAETILARVKDVLE